MNHIIIYAHPNPASLSSSYLKIVEEVSRSNSHNTTVRNLYEMHFDPILKGRDFENLFKGDVADDIKQEQEFITNSDFLTFIYPIWWTGMPAILKGYIDRVFTAGFAFNIYEDGTYTKLLTGKKALIINNMGTPEPMYFRAGMVDALRKTSDIGIFNFCGINVVDHKFFGSAATSPPNVLSQYTKEVRGLINKHLPLQKKDTLR